MTDAPDRTPIPPGLRAAVLVGEAPPSWAQPGQCIPLYDRPEGCAGHRLRLMTHLDHFEYLSAFRRINLQYEYAKWSIPGARVWAHELLPYLKQYRAVVLVGSRVREAFADELPVNAKQVAAKALVSWGETRVGWVPHPSGRNLWYNTPANRERVGAYLGDLRMKWKPWDSVQADVLRELRLDNLDPRSKP